jgi:hypothetical protein
MKSYIKIYGPPVAKALNALRKIAIDMPEVCIMDTIIEYTNEAERDLLGDTDSVLSFFKPMGDITRKRCENIISKSGESVGEFDFYFEWFVKPNSEQLNMLIEAVDEALAPTGVRYSITTK